MKGSTRAALAAVLALVTFGCDGASGDPDGGAVDARVTDGGPRDSATDGGEDEPEVTAGRLVIGDMTASTVHVVDLDDPSARWTVTVAAPGRVHGHPFSRYAYVANGTMVEILESGITIESHNDHGHIAKSDPALADARIEDSSATSFVVHGEGAGRYAVAFNATEGVDSTVTLLQERTLSAGTPSFVDVDLGAAFEGVAVAAFGHLVVSHPEGNGVTVRALATPDQVEETYDTQCPELAGMAANAHGVVFGCDDALLVLAYHDGHFDLERLPYPEGTLAGVRVTALRSTLASELLVGTFGSDLVIVDVEATSPFRLLELPAGATVVDFELDMAGEHLLVLTSDGNLRRYVLATGEAEGAPIHVLDADHTVPADLAVGPVDAYVADPSAGHVVVVDIEGWTDEGRLEVGGAPSSLVVVTVSPDYQAQHEH